MMKAKKEMQVTLGVLLLAIAIILTAQTVFGYEIQGNSVIYDSEHANMTVTPHTVYRPNVQWQEFNVQSKASDGELCVAYVFNDTLLDGTVQLWREYPHQYTYCYDEEATDCETRYSIYEDWDDVTHLFNNLEYNGKQVYYHITPLHFNTYDNHTWRIKYKPQANEGKWDLWTWNSQTGNCYNDYVGSNYNFLYKLDPWWNSTNVTSGYVYLTNLSYTDRFEDYSYLLGDSCEVSGDWIVAYEATDLTASATRIEHDKSIEILHDPTASATDYARLLNNNWGNISIVDYDTLAFWYYVSDAENAIRPSDSYLMKIFIQSNATHEGKITNVYNHSTQSDNYQQKNITLETGWNKITISLADMYTFDTYDPELVFGVRFNFYGDNVSNVTKRIDHIHFYNSSNYYNTVRWASQNYYELQMIENRYGYNTTMLAGTANSERTMQSNSFGIPYNNYELIFDMYKEADFGSDRCILFAENASGDYIASAYFQQTASGLKLVIDTTNVLIPYASSAGARLTFKLVSNNSFLSWYYSDDQGVTWTLGYNHTSIRGDMGKIELYTRDAICGFDNIVIRELMPTSVESTGMTFTPSFIYTDFDEQAWTNTTVEWILDGTTQYTDTYDGTMTDFTNYSRVLENEGTWTVNVTVCDADGCAETASNNSVYLDTNTFDITLYDEETEHVIDWETLYVNVIGDTGAYIQNFSTANGLINVSDVVSDSYDMRYWGGSYNPREYYVTFEGGTNQEVYLYLLNESASVSNLVVLTVYDQNSDIAPNIIVKMQRNYVSENVSVFKTVSMTRTNFEGQAALYVELYDVWYKLIFEDENGNVLEISEPSPFFSTSVTETVNLAEDTFYSWREYDNVIYNIDFVNQSGTFFARFTYSDTNNLVREGCLNLQRITAQDITTICHNCTSSSSATISCIFDETATGQYKAVGLIDTNTTNSWYTLATEFFSRVDVISFGQEGVFLGVMMIGTLMLMGIGSVVGSLLLMIVGLIASILLGILGGFTLKLVYWIIILTLIIIFLVKRARS